ncbi:conserved hypothetical protein [Ricinus communis]|uniref:Uncharacterized protein n=1 Tax=Ricinus communis TaxID=3988 RepID=B9RRF0_RICCO|nr:conserved hypothetical protein [Ricinus communis]
MSSSSSSTSRTVRKSNMKFHYEGEWHDEPISDRIKDLLNLLKEKKVLLLSENKSLKAMKRANESGGDLNGQIDELWEEVMSLKNQNLIECERMRKKMRIGYVLVLVSSQLFFFLIFCYWQSYMYKPECNLSMKW